MFKKSVLSQLLLKGLHIDLIVSQMSLMLASSCLIWDLSSSLLFLVKSSFPPLFYIERKSKLLNGVRAPNGAKQIYYKLCQSIHTLFCCHDLKFVQLFDHMVFLQNCTILDVKHKISLSKYIVCFSFNFSFSQK